jgi:hypothetical protein
MRMIEERRETGREMVKKKCVWERPDAMPLPHGASSLHAYWLHYVC